MVVLIEDRISFVLPPEPVLNDSIQRNAFAAVAICNRDHLIERLITVLRLDKAIRPAWQHGRVARQGAILMDDPIHLRAIDKEVINPVPGRRVEREFEREAVIEIGERSRVPDNSVTSRRYQ